MDVFGAALGASGQFLRDAAIDAAYELGLVDGFDAPQAHRLRALVELLVALGVLRREGERFVRGDVPPRPASVTRAGWGLLAQVIRADVPLVLPPSARMHAHLAQAGAAAAAEVAALATRLRENGVGHDDVADVPRGTRGESVDVDLAPAGVPAIDVVGRGVAAVDVTAAEVPCGTHGELAHGDVATAHVAAAEDRRVAPRSVRKSSDGDVEVDGDVDVGDADVGDVPPADVPRGTRDESAVADVASARVSAVDDRRVAPQSVRKSSRDDFEVDDDIDAVGVGTGNVDLIDGVDPRDATVIARLELARARCGTHVAGAVDTQVRVLDLGGGAGTYAAAFLELHPYARATIVDFADAIIIARDHLARFGERVTFVEGDARITEVGRDFDIIVLANLLHLHGPSACAELCAVAARAAKPGGLVLVKDLRLDDDRGGPIEGLLFALNMALYTDAGDVYTAAQIRAWLADAGLEHLAEHRLDIAPDAFVIAGRRPRPPGAISMIQEHLASRLSRVGKIAWREIRAEGRLRRDAQPTHLQFPDAFSKRLASAIAISSDPAIERHYLEVMPHMRLAQVISTDEPGATFMHTRLDWSRLPRMSAALDRLYAVLVDANAETKFSLGSPNAFRAQTDTLAQLFMRTHYGACMPLLYGYPADLRYFAASGARRGDDLMTTIDRYFVAPMIHELCHFARDRDTLPTHLDECIGGWLGVYVWPEFAYPVGDADDALAESPRLAQVGQAFARAFGIKNIVRAQSGAMSWREALGDRVVDAAEALCDEDWRRRRTTHLLSDTANPRPWVAFALAARAGVNLRALTLASLQERPFDPLPPDDAFDRAIVDDALRAMCLETYVIDGSMRVRVRRPDSITVDAGGIRAGTSWYWIPPALVSSADKLII